MSDFTEFKDVLNGFEKELRYECENPLSVNLMIKDIKDMVETMVQKRDERIKELEGKSSPKKPVTSVEKPKKECPPGKIINPKTGRCINKPKEKTQKKRGRPKKNPVVDIPDERKRHSKPIVRI